MPQIEIPQESDRWDRLVAALTPLLDTAPLQQEVFTEDKRATVIDMARVYELTDMHDQADNGIYKVQFQEDKEAGTKMITRIDKKEANVGG